MSTSSEKLIKSRILAATNKSKIAVFKDGNGGFEAKFENIVATARRIKKRDRDYIGSFFGLSGSESAAFLMSR